jgi:hypothetical protein
MARDSYYFFITCIQYMQDVSDGSKPLELFETDFTTRDRQVPIHTCLGDPLTHEPWISALASAVLCTDLRSAREMSQNIAQYSFLNCLVPTYYHHTWIGAFVRFLQF